MKTRRILRLSLCSGLLLLRAVGSCLLVTVISQGVETNSRGGFFARVIKRGITLPNRKSRYFTTCFENQTSVQVKIYEGEWNLPEKNRWIGSLILNNVTPRREHIIKVTFHNDVFSAPNCTSDDWCGYACFIWRLRVTATVEQETGIESSASFDLTDGYAFVNRNRRREKWIENLLEELIRMETPDCPSCPDCLGECEPPVAEGELPCLPPVPLFLLP